MSWCGRLKPGAHRRRRARHHVGSHAGWGGALSSSPTCSTGASPAPLKGEGKVIRGVGGRQGHGAPTLSLPSYAGSERGKIKRGIWTHLGQRKELKSKAKPGSGNCLQLAETSRLGGHILFENVGLAISECPHQETRMNLESPLFGNPSAPTCTQDGRLGHSIVTPLLFNILSIFLVYQIQASRNQVPSALK